MAPGPRLRVTGVTFAHFGTWSATGPLALRSEPKGKEEIQLPTMIWPQRNRTVSSLGRSGTCDRLAPPRRRALSPRTPPPPSFCAERAK